MAFTYPGQGAQAQGMGLPWVDHPSWELVVEASAISSRDVAHLLLEADAEELKQTRNSQLATYVMSMVALDAVERTGIEPAFHAGHSLGEYSALTGSGVLSFSGGVRLVAERGDAMQAAAEDAEGTMAAVLGLDDDQVDLACRRANGEVWVANYNSAGQVVIAGDADGLAKAGELAKDLGAKRVMPLKVGGAFHTPLMSSARDRLRKAIADTEFRDAHRPVYANVDAAPYQSAEDWPGLLGAQLTSPVRWRQTLHALDDAGTTVFLEIGPGTTLTGLAKRAFKGADKGPGGGPRFLSVSGPEDLDAVLDNLSSARQSAIVAEGESLYAVERLVVSPANGVFEPDPSVTPGHELARGDTVGVVGSTQVLSAFAGRVEGLLALAGERVTTSQPLAWLRTPSVGQP